MEKSGDIKNQFIYSLIFIFKYKTLLNTFFFILTFLKMACTLQVLANMAPKAVVYPTMRIHVRTYQNNGTHVIVSRLKKA